MFHDAFTKAYLDFVFDLPTKNILMIDYSEIKTMSKFMYGGKDQSIGPDLILSSRF